jgi:hypothetical protein
MFIKTRVHVLGRPFQVSPMLVGKVRSLPYNEAPERYFTRVGTGLTHKHKTWLERTARDKPS